MRSLAAQLLITPSALQELSLEDAAKVVNYMHHKTIPAGTVFMREGDDTDSDHMLLVLDGDLSVEHHPMPNDENQLVVRIMGPGSLIGELGLLDGAPRSASCVADTDIQAAVLHRRDFLRLLDDEPRVGARLLLAIAKRMADHLRDSTRKLMLFSQMNKVLSEELANYTKGSDTSP
ncbi:cyclic nucleotide-binding domain-containing protein [Hydrogenophaga aquatica]